MGPLSEPQGDDTDGPEPEEAEDEERLEPRSDEEDTWVTLSLPFSVIPSSSLELICHLLVKTGSTGKMKSVRSAQGCNKSNVGEYKARKREKYKYKVHLC